MNEAHGLDHKRGRGVCGAQPLSPRPSRRPNVGERGKVPGSNAESRRHPSAQLPCKKWGSVLNPSLSGACFSVASGLRVQEAVLAGPLETQQQFLI